MSHVEDRWYRTVRAADGSTRRVRSPRYGKGLRWRARYLDPDGAARNRSFPVKALAERFLTEVEHSKMAGTYRDPDAGRVTLRKFAAGWARGFHQDSARGETVRRHLDLHILPALGGVMLAELERRPSMVQQFLSGLKMGHGGAGQVAITLRALLDAALDDGLITRNPAKAGSVRIPRQPQRKVTPWTAGQIEAIRGGLPGRYRAVADCGAGLGLRQGEIFGLAADCVAFLQRKVYVVRQVKRASGRLWFAAPKGGKAREVPLPATVAARLAAHIEAYPPAAVTLPWNEPGSRRHGEPVTAALLFHRHGAPLHHSTFNTTAWRPARDAAGITEGGLHQLRHCYASVLLAGGVDVKALSEYLGHHDAAITLRVYSHLMPSAEGRALRAVEAALDQHHVPHTSPEQVNGP